jgi:hypothetical protein
VPTIGGRSAPIAPSSTLLASPLLEAGVHDVATQVAPYAALARRSQVGRTQLRAGQMRKRGALPHVPEGQRRRQASRKEEAGIHPPRDDDPASDASGER